MSENLPEYWRQWLSERGRLSAYDFRTGSVVSLRFVDGSTVVFKFAFFVLSQPRDELAVFTEHCGYHVFRLSALEEYRCFDDSGVSEVE